MSDHWVEEVVYPLHQDKARDTESSTNTSVIIEQEYHDTGGNTDGP